MYCACLFFVVQRQKVLFCLNFFQSIDRMMRDNMMYLMIQMYQHRGEKMLTGKRIVILLVIAIVAFLSGRLAFRGFLNLLLGGTLFGGNWF